MSYLASTLPLPPPVRRIGRWLLAASLAAFVAVAPQHAHAQEMPAPKDEAIKSLVREGHAALKRRDLPGARAAFAAAWSQRQHFAIAVSFAEVEMALGRYTEAAELWRFVIATIPDDLTDKREQAVEQLAKCKTQVGTITVQAHPDGATVTLDGAEAGASPLKRELYVEPGDHRISAEKDGRRSASRDFRISAGSRLHFDLIVPDAPTAPPQAAAAPPRAPEHHAPASSADSSARGGLRTPLLIGGVVLTAASVTVGAVFTLKSNAASDDVQAALSEAVAASDPSLDPYSICARPERPRGCTIAATRNADAVRFRNIAIASFVTGGVAAIGTAATYLFWPRRSPPHRLTFTPSLHDRSIGVSISGAF